MTEKSQTMRMPLTGQIEYTPKMKELGIDTIKVGDGVVFDYRFWWVNRYTPVVGFVSEIGTNRMHLTYIPDTQSHPYPFFYASGLNGFSYKRIRPDSVARIVKEATEGT